MTEKTVQNMGEGTIYLDGKMLDKFAPKEIRNLPTELAGRLKKLYPAAIRFIEAEVKEFAEAIKEEVVKVGEAVEAEAEKVTRRGRPKKTEESSEFAAETETPVSEPAIDEATETK